MEMTEIPQIDGRRDYWIAQLANADAGHDPSLYGRMTAREFYAWFIVPNRQRKERLDKMTDGYNTGHSNYGFQPGDTVLADPPETGLGTLFFLNALGVQGVPKVGENGQAKEPPKE